MPSNKDPNAVVNPGPGRLPAGTVPASSLLFVSGGGGGAALSAHILNPHDAHMASAIGVNPYYPPGGTTPVLSSVGGPVDGESVLDFIEQAKYLFPIRPNRMGFDNPAVANVGLPSWGIGGLHGAYTNGTAAVFSHFITPNTWIPGPTMGVLYPADRGVLAVYFSTDGDFLNAGTTTLYAALWLGSTAARPAALTCPSANFNESLRDTTQVNYTATNVSPDVISLTYRLPYLKDYTPYPGVPYAAYTADFPAYQVAEYSLVHPGYGAGPHGSYLIVHWRETYAISNAAIAPAAMAANYLAANIYSAYPPNYDAVPEDTAGIQSLNRRYIFRDVLSAAAPTVSSWTITETGVIPTIQLSGVTHYNVPFVFNTDLRVDGLVDNAWLPGTIASGALLPADFVTTADPIAYDLTDFGALTWLPVPYYLTKKTGAGSTYTNTAAPQVGDQVQHVDAALAYAGMSTPHTPTLGIARVVAQLRRPASSAAANSSIGFMYNSWAQTGITSSTDTFEPFRDEKYRYVTTHTPVATDRIDPTLSAPPAHYDSTIAITAGTQDAQVVGDQLIYPRIDYTAMHPAGPDYFAVLSADAASHIRIYQRAFNTGIARNTGRIRVKGLTLAAFAAGPFTGNPAVDHPGGALLSVQVPGATGHCDLGRTLGDPDLNLVPDLHGCQTGVLSLSATEHIISYSTPGFFTADNGAGEYPIFFGAAFIKGPGTSLSIDEVEWLPP